MQANCWSAFWVSAGRRLQLPDHQFDDIVRIAFGVNAAQVPDPMPLAVIECEQALVCERRNELDREERVARRLLVNQFRQRGAALRFAVKGVRQQSGQDRHDRAV